MREETPHFLSQEIFLKQYRHSSRNGNRSVSDDDCPEGIEMKPPAFAYYAPTRIDDTLRMLHEFVREQNLDVKLLAGGQSLVPLLNMRLAHPEVIVDLNPLEPQLNYMHRDGDMLHIGALTRYYLLRTNPEILQHCPMLAEAAGLIGHVAILTRGTIGGSLVHADPAAELPLVFATLSGIVMLQSAQRSRVIAARDFFLSYLTTSVEPDEILTEVALPIMPARSGQAIEEFSMRHGDFALVAAAAQVTLAADASLQRVQLGIGGVGATPVDCSHLLTPLVGKGLTQPELREALRHIEDEIDPQGDIHASAEYRKELAQTLAYRAIERAIQHAGSGLL
jgi:CO/xanthine dehydrogenase FAD-binding subunit